MHSATHAGHLNIIKILVEIGQAKLDLKNLEGGTSLHLSASKTFIEITSYLLHRKQMNLELIATESKV